MGLFDIFKRNKEFENKKDDLFSIPCDYDGYDFVFKSNITNPSIYDEITKILTNDKISIKNITSPITPNIIPIKPLNNSSKLTINIFILLDK